MFYLRFILVFFLSVCLSGCNAEASFQLVNSARVLILTVSTVLAVFLIIKAIILLSKYAKNPNNPKNSIGRISRHFIAGGALSSIITVGFIFANTITGTGDICDYAGKVSVEAIEEKSGSGGCLDLKGSDISIEKAKQIIGDENTDYIKQFMYRIGLFFLVIHTVGFYYFVKSFCLLASVSNGNTQGGYGKIFIMMIFSTIAMDFQTSLAIVITTAVSIFN